MDEKIVAALFVRPDSLYYGIPGVDCYNATRDARTFPGGLPIIARPPCRAWGALAHMAKPAPGEMDLAVWSVDMVRQWGGVVEHPAGSRLWPTVGAPAPGMFPDQWGGFTVYVDQYWFDHVANKPTIFYIVGKQPATIPPIPYNPGLGEKSMTGQVEGTARATQYEREYTPMKLARWLVSVATGAAPAGGEAPTGLGIDYGRNVWEGYSKHNGGGPCSLP